MKRATSLVLIVLALALAGAGSHHPRAATAGVRLAQPPEPEIVRLVGRTHTIIVTAGHRGPHYSVSTASGQVLVSQATLEDLRLHHPDLYRLVEPATVLDASVDFAQ